ncbi:MAG: hypothetical protein V5A27_01620 [Halapricum sp.]
MNGDCVTGTTPQNRSDHHATLSAVIVVGFVSFLLSIAITAV